MDQVPLDSRAIKTVNHNRNLVLAMLRREPVGRYSVMEDGLSPFGIPLLFGIQPTVYLCAEFYPYDWLPRMAVNANLR